MKSLLLSLALLAAGAYCSAQQLPYHTLSIEDVMKIYNGQQDYVYLDVRSRGEYSDTSRWESANIGYIKGAINIPVQELDKRIGEIRKFQDRKIIVYCSHSYRSRVASKMLVDSGFKQVYNMNSGLSGYYNTESWPAATPGMIAKTTAYTHISAGELYNMLRTNKDVQFIEMVPETYQPWDSASLPLYSSYGSFKGARRYTYKELEAGIGQIQELKNKTIVLYAPMSLLSSKAAAYLAGQGFSSVYNLTNSILSWYYFTSNKGWDAVAGDIRPYVFADNNPFSIISVKKGCRMAEDGAVVLDIRPAKVFSDTTEGQVYNYTHMKHAVNMPAAEVKDRINELKKYKKKDLLIMDSEDEPANIATVQYLAAQGYKVCYLPTGLRNWEWHNNNDATFKCGNMLELIPKSK